MSADRSARSVEVGRPRDARRRRGRAISTSRRVPIRQGIVLPHASSAQKRVSSRARSTTQARSSATTTEPEPTWAPAARSGVELVRRVEEVGRQQAARRAADEDGLERDRPSAARRRGRRSRAAASRAAPRRSRRRRAPRTWTRIVPGLAFEPIAANALGAVADDPRHGGEGLDVVDDRRHVEQAALRGMRRPLLRLAALALERLEQDGLLAEHVGALDRPDRDRRGRGPEPRTSEPMKPASSAAPIAASSRRIGLGRLGPDRDDRLGRRRSRTPRSRRPR